jgi:carbon monoxide dehydrogenase subunit G
MHVVAHGIGATIEIDSRMRVEPAAEGSLLHWTAQVTRLEGLVATVSKPLIQAAAGQVAKSTWEKVRRRVEQG